MGRGRRWTDAECRMLEEMVQNGVTLQGIVGSGKFEGRSLQAIGKQIERLRLRSFVVGGKKSFVGQIGRAVIPNFEDFVARYVDAFDKLCGMVEYSREDLERFRLIFMAAWKYRDLFREYEKFEEVKVRVERLEKLVEQLLSEKKTEAVEKAA